MHVKFIILIISFLAIIFSVQSKKTEKTIKPKEITTTIVFPFFEKDTFMLSGHTFQILERKSGRNLNAKIKNGEIKIINQGVQYFEYRIIYYVFSSLDDERMPVVRNYDGRISYSVQQMLKEAAIGGRYIFEEIIIVDKGGIILNNEVKSILIERVN